MSQVQSEKVKMISDKSAARLTSLMIERGFEVLSQTTEGLARMRVWSLRCGHGHEFAKEGRRLNVLEKCPQCHCASVEENGARLLIEEYFNAKFPNVRPGWLINEETGQTMELDMLNEELGLAFEYNGPVHYKDMFGLEKLNQVQERDALKKEICKANGINLIFIRSIKKFTSKIALMNRVAEDLGANGYEVTEEMKKVVSKKSFTEGKVTNNANFMNLLERNQMIVMGGSYENQDSRMKVGYSLCKHVYSKSYRELRINEKSGHMACCKCRMEKELLEKRLNKIKGYAYVVTCESPKQIEAVENCKMVGKKICLEKGWIFLEAKRGTAGHFTFTYSDENQDVFSFPLLKYRAYRKNMEKELMV